MAATRVLYDSIFDTLTELEDIKTVQDFNNQYNNTENYNLVKYPAVYVESPRVNWQKGQNSFVNREYTLTPQFGTARIKIHIVMQTLESFTKEAKDKFYDIIDIVTNSLQRLQCDEPQDGTFTTLMRVSEDYPKPNKQLRICVIEFETQLKDVFEIYKPLTAEIETVTVTISTEIN